MPPVRRQISPYAARLRRGTTEAERKFWYAVRDRRLDGFKFRRQATIGPFVVDFLCVDARLVVELDGGQHSAEVDASRTGFLQSRGYRVLRFWNNEVTDQFEGVLQTIVLVLHGVEEDPHRCD